MKRYSTTVVQLLIRISVTCILLGYGGMFSTSANTHLAHATDGIVSQPSAALNQYTMAMSAETDLDSTDNFNEDATAAAAVAISPYRVPIYIVSTGCPEHRRVSGRVIHIAPKHGPPAYS